MCPSVVLTPSRSTGLMAVGFFVLVFVGVLVYSDYIDRPMIRWNTTTPQISKFKNITKPNPPTPLPPFACPMQTKSKTTNPKCPQPQPTHPFATSDDTTHVCPDYFRWIHQDLKPWKSTGITKDMLGRNSRPHFKLVVVNGRAYVESYSKPFQTRDVFTMFGIVQLLRRYPGRIPDLELVFNCNDHPGIMAKDYKPHRGPNGSTLVPPPQFGYCGDDRTLDIAFPDWSFWGWPEINIKPWEKLLEEIKEENKKTKWEDREPYAYWKGNPTVAMSRRELMRCNVSPKQDWHARLFPMYWNKETKSGFKTSNLANQCTYRYKIYVEGRAWSVSEKYILACDSPTLLIATNYYDFFTRGLMPTQHYWPVRARDKCRSIKFAVDWGNQHLSMAKAIGKEGSEFIHEKLKMDYVYDYMYHLLNEYSKLLKFKPTIPPKAVEICTESMACSQQGVTRQAMMESMVNYSQSVGPCLLPPPFESIHLKARLDLKTNLTRKVQALEDETWSKEKERKKRH